MANVLQISFERAVIGYREDGVVALLFSIAHLQQFQDADRFALKYQARIGRGVVND
jgi:hypothetical protein